MQVDQTIANHPEQPGPGWIPRHRRRGLLQFQECVLHGVLCLLDVPAIAPGVVPQIAAVGRPGRFNPVVVHHLGLQRGRSTPIDAKVDVFLP